MTLILSIMGYGYIRSWTSWLMIEQISRLRSLTCLQLFHTDSPADVTSFYYKLLMKLSLNQDCPPPRELGTYHGYPMTCEHKGLQALGKVRVRCTGNRQEAGPEAVLLHYLALDATK